MPPLIWSQPALLDVQRLYLLRLTCDPVRLELSLDAIYDRSGLEANRPLA